MQRVRLERRGNIMEVILNRPDKMNAFDLDMFYELDKVRKSIHANRSLRAVVISGSGKNFSSGLDVKKVMGDRSSMFKLLWKWLPFQLNLAQRICVAWRRIPIPVIAAINGKCWGAGMQLALGCDYRLADPESSFSIMEARWGLIPDMGGSLALREIMPLDKAMQLTMLAEPIDSERALSEGLITEVVDKPVAAAMELASQLEARSPDAIAGIKKLYHLVWHSNDRALIARESFYQWRMIFGKNLKIAAEQQRGKAKPFKVRGWW